MRYAVLGGGKRLRPILCLWTHAMLASDADAAESGAAALDAGCALELVHTYSLVHDDLPCMDDDDLRRGRPTCHVKFGEAIAVLAGDALQALAFETMVQATWRAAAAARAAVRTLARAAGHRHLVGGQALDLDSSTAAPTPARLGAIHQGKTAALIAAAMQLGGIAAGADDRTLAAVGAIGTDLGLAFQITDDILDVTGGAADLGKTVGKDARAGKLTAVALHGLDGAQARAGAHVEAAVSALQAWPRSAALRALAAWLAQRRG
jgi:geranylgeranyl pyrophosphate synthase